MARRSEWRAEFFDPLQVLRDELGRVLSRQRAAGGQAPTEVEPTEWAPPMELVEFPDHLRAWADLPGVDYGSIELTVVGTTLSLRGTRRAPEYPSGRPHLQERPFGPFRRQLALPCEVDIGAVTAEMREGVLDIRLPKIQAARPRTIPVKSHNREGAGG